MNDASHTGRPLIVAHRGASAVERENTLEAFEAAVRMGADAIEFDVRRTRDGVFVIHHDAAIAGSTTPIADLDYVDAGKLAKDSGFHLPTLQETIDMCRGRILLDIELKEQGCEGEVVLFIRKRADAASIVITSFHDDTIRRIKFSGPEVRAGLILGVDPPASINIRVSELFPVGRLRRCRADFVVPHHRLLRFWFASRMRSAGYPIWVWTVDDPSLAGRLAGQGIAGIITNSPERWVNQAL